MTRHKDFIDTDSESEESFNPRSSIRAKHVKMSDQRAKKTKPENLLNNIQSNGLKMLGEVISVHKNGITANVEGEQRFCLFPDGRNNSEAARPVVNDVVDLEQREDQFIITDIKPRKTFVARYDHFKQREQGFASNIDVVFIVTSANKEFSINRIKRFAALCGDQPIRKFVVLTKTDLTDKVSEYEKELALNDCPQKVLINAADKSDADKLLSLIKPNEACLLLGSSGVGKTTIINSLCGLNLKTRDVKADKFLNKGKHTTSARTMYYLDNGRKIIDIPGVRIVGLADEME